MKYRIISVRTFHLIKEWPYIWNSKLVISKQHLSLPQYCIFLKAWISYMQISHLPKNKNGSLNGIQQAIFSWDFKCIQVITFARAIKSGENKKVARNEPKNCSALRNSFYAPRHNISVHSFCSRALELCAPPRRYITHWQSHLLPRVQPDRNRASRSSEKTKLTPRRDGITPAPRIPSAL